MNVTMVVHARRSQLRVTSLATKTSLMSLVIIQLEVSRFYAHPLAGKKAAEVLTAIQTIVGQVNSEFQGDVTRKNRLGAVSRLHGDSAWEISGGKVRVWARNKGFKVTSTAGGDPSNNSRAERWVGILKRMGENDDSRQ